MKLLCTMSLFTKLTLACLLVGFLAGLTVGTSIATAELPTPPDKANVQMDNRTMSR
jgi:hypothetical protein